MAEHLPTWLLLGAALGWLATLELHVTSVGTGSALSGRELADLVSGGALSATVPRWLGVAWYGAPMAGGLILLTAPVRTPWASAARGVAAATASVVSLTYTSKLTDLDPGRFGSGAIASCAGALLAVAAGATALANRQKKDRP